MSHETQGQTVQVEVNAPVEAQPVTEASLAAAVAAEPSEPKQPAPSKAASKKVTAKAKDAKNIVVEQAPPKEVAAKAPQVQKRPTKSAKKVVTESKPEAAKVEKVAKEKKQAPKKPKLVRDSFTIPETDYELFETLKLRALSAGAEVKKSELLRAALATLAKLDDAEFIKTIGLVERIKTGRPKK